MIVATIHNAANDPLQDYDVYYDEDFAAVEADALERAKDGKRYYIHWWRDTDGQCGFWGPAGASFEVQWYGGKR